MRVALTGSTGLIGGGVLQLLRSNHEIVRIGRRQECDMHVDLADIRTIATLDLAGCDALIHCAGVVDEDFVTSPQRTWGQAIAGAEELAKRALIGGVERIIYLSTTHVYGAFQGIISEDRIPDPSTHYAIAHYATEQILKSYARKGLKVFIVRPNAVYGIPVDWDGFDRWALVPFNLPLQAAYKGTIVLKTSGEQTRNFIALEDVAQYVEQLLTASVKDEVIILNAVGSDTLRIVDLAQMCADIYYDLTGRICLIEKPVASAGHLNDYQFVTRHTVFSPSRHIGDFLTAFLVQVMEKAKKGVVYGQYV
ncbi:MAG: NAD(P)-dependent oxidoreductase [Candidatus Omnitrophica bacterium]|nr:NAD(P)-dependent oxidoreductase [Candidatus Omnitrophota bacterium]